MFANFFDFLRTFKWRFIDKMMLGIIGLLTSLVVLAILLLALDKNVNVGAHYKAHIAEMKLLNKSFDTFLSSEIRFLNYDLLVRQTKTFEAILDEYSTPFFYDHFGHTLTPILKNLTTAYHEKLLLIEEKKALNASILNSMHYIFDLYQTIQADNTIEHQTLVYVENVTFSILQMIMEIQTNDEALALQLKEIEKKDAFHQNTLLQFFYKHAQLLVVSSHALHEVNHRFEATTLEEKTSHFEATLERIIKRQLLFQKTIVFLFFCAALIVSVLLSIIYFRSLKLKEDLVAFKYAVENSDNTIVITDKERNILYVNEAFEKNTGYTKAQALGKNPRILKSGDLPEEYYAAMNAQLDRGEKWIGEFVNKKANGEIFYEQASITPMFINKILIGYLAIKLNVTDYIRQQQQISFFAHHDSLTLLPNRKQFEDTMRERLSRKIDEPLALLYVDLDGFKTINDTLGHDVGDTLLKQVALRLKHYLQEMHQIYRIGGDEFVIVVNLNDIHLDDLNTISRTILGLLNQPFYDNAHEMRIGASIGIALYPEDGNDLRTLLSHADVAMYNVKDRGKNNFQYYNKEFTETIHTRLHVENALKKALDTHEISLVFQPLYTASNHSLIAIEVLLRWHNEELGEVSPEKFITIAEECGCIKKLTLFTLHEAFKSFLHVKKFHPSLKQVSLNLSAAQLGDETFNKTVLDVAKQHHIPLSAINFEIAETVLVKNITFHAQKLAQLRHLGVNITLDNFGIGYASMAYLKTLPIDTLKIDRTLMQTIAKESHTQSMLETIIQLGKTLGCQVMAKGIETQEQLSFVENNHIDALQGFFLSPPLCLEALLENPYASSLAKEP